MKLSDLLKVEGTEVKVGKISQIMKDIVVVECDALLTNIPHKEMYSQVAGLKEGSPVLVYRTKKDHTILEVIRPEDGLIIYDTPS